MFFPLILLVVLCSLPELRAFKSAEERHCMDDNYLCLDMGWDGTWSLGDRQIPAPDLMFSMSAERELKNETFKKVHVWHFYVNATQKQANVTLQIVHKGEASSRKLMIQRTWRPVSDLEARTKGQTHKSEMLVQFWVKKSGKWAPLPEQRKKDLFVDPVIDDSAENIQIKSTVKFSRALKLESMKYGLWINMWSWDESHGYRNITVSTPQEFYLFQSKRRQKVAGVAQGTAAVTIAIIVAMAVLGATAVLMLVVLVVMRSRRSHLTSTSIHSDVASFKSVDSTIMDHK